ncbi:thioredoxin TrxC [Vitreoscilla massiliensis]|uniref:Thioredoxin n=1 Tax=Vitreoscilla massiliensis TaxID=1689272 RepID=A0ABY4DZ49_9NEIS|nr:thioredoxin TrxC [Vitreoscilla massiliensis]UOO88808.1 thioredoxin TrxC [Vitreoscilla massiliensis]
MNETLHCVCPHCHSTNRVPVQKLTEQPVCGHCKEALITGKPVVLDQDSFARHIQRSQFPVVVDFWAPWCGPCQMMAPAFAEAAERLKFKAQLCKLDTEAHPQTAAPYGIRSIPTMAVFKEGQEIARVSGAMPVGEIVRWVESVL